jgi:hypothetical protein
MSDDRLFERLSCHDENFCTRYGLENDLSSFWRKVEHITIFERLLIRDEASPSHEDHRIVSFWKGESDFSLSRESYIVEFYRREGFCCSFLLVY